MLSEKDSPLFSMRELRVSLHSPCSRNSTLTWWKCRQFSLFRTINYYLLDFQKQAGCARSGSDKWSGIPHPLYSGLVQHQLWTLQLGNVQHFHSESGTWFHFLVINKKVIKQMSLWDKITKFYISKYKHRHSFLYPQETELSKTTHVGKNICKLSDVINQTLPKER